MAESQQRVIVQGIFDDLRSHDLRFLEEASLLGPVLALVFDDPAAKQLIGKQPKFPVAERLYVLKALRFVSEVRKLETALPDSLPDFLGPSRSTWVVQNTDWNASKEAYARSREIALRVIRAEALLSVPPAATRVVPPSADRKKVIVTGCYDWFHSGHVRFFEEVSDYGDLYVVVGHDANIRLLKGAGHPLIPAHERRYMVETVRFVKQALISTGTGWLDAEPEIARVRPDIYAVNEDGDKGRKREFCRQHGIEYVLLKRTPAPGLPVRSSTELRGF